MQLGIFAKTFPRPTVEETFDAVIERDLDSVQFNMACAGLPSLPEQIETNLAVRIGEAARSRGIAMAAVSGTYNMIHPNIQVRKQGLNRLRVLAAACHNMGTQIITVCTGTRDPENMWRSHPDNTSPQAWADLLEALDAALRIAEEEQITLAFEPEQANVISTAAKGHELLHTIQSPRLKVVIDPANLITSAHAQRQILDEAFDLLGEHLIIAHAKDRDLHGAFRAAGEGMIDYSHYLTLLQAINFQGPIILHGLAEDQVDTSLQFLKNTLRRNAEHP